MCISFGKSWRSLLAALLLSGSFGAQAATSNYVPFSLLNLSQTQWIGIWLADVGNAGAAPIQLTNQPLDGGNPANYIEPMVAVLNSWSYNASTGEATNVQAQLVVYGVGGHLYQANLTGIPTVTPFSNGSYAALCSLVPLDSQSYTPSTGYVQAVVEPAGSTDTCASGLGTQTWLIPASADGTVAPTVEPSNWSVLGAFTDTSGSFNRWVVWTGSAVVTYLANFTDPYTILVGPPAGPAPQLIGNFNGDAMLLASSDSGGVHSDTLYHVNPNGGGRVANLSYPDTAVCASQGYAFFSVSDGGTHNLLISEPTSTGYTVYRVGVGGGPLSTIYTDSSGNVCGSVAGVATPAGYVAINTLTPGTGTYTVVSVREGGPATQTPVYLAGSATVFAQMQFTIDGHFWIFEEDSSGPNYVLDTQVIDGDGTVVQTYDNMELRGDQWGGFFPSGMPGVDRQVIYLFSPTNSPSCSAGTLTAINTATFAATDVRGLPADACAAGGFGWSPINVGFVQEPAGQSPVEINPAGGQIYFLLGPAAGNIFTLASAVGYPFI